MGSLNSVGVSKLEHLLSCSPCLTEMWLVETLNPAQSINQSVSNIYNDHWLSLVINSKGHWACDTHFSAAI